MVHRWFERGYIQMADNAAFVDEVYAKIKACSTYISLADLAASLEEIVAARPRGQLMAA